jgi:putative peptidoglycan lipid II flippase
MAESLAAFAPTVPALAVIGLLSRACYVRGRAVLAGAVVGLAWLATTVTPLVVLDPDRADGPATLRILALGSSIGLVSGAIALTYLVARVWGGSALSVPGRSIVAALTGAVVAAVVGWLAGTRIVATDLLGAVGLAALVGVGSAVVMAGVALMVDPGLARRLRQLRRPVPGSADTGSRP